MAFNDTPNKLESAFIQRNALNTFYEQVNISGSDLIFYHSSSGEFTADKISIWASKYGIGTIAQSRTLILCMGTTPSTTGGSTIELPVPYSSDGVTGMTWAIARFNLRVQLSGSSTSNVKLEKSSGNGIFSAVEMCNLILNANSYETTTGSLQTVVSGDKLRFNVNTIGTSQFWTITAEITSL